MTKLVTKVSLTTFAPKAYAGQMAVANGPTSIALGVIVGIANKIVTGKQADGVTTYEGMGGNFEVNFATGEEQVRAGKCFLPESFMDPILDLLRVPVFEDGKAGKPKAESVQFAYKVAIIKAANPAGYSWELTPLMDADEADPLAALRTSAMAALPKADPVKQVENKAK